MKKIYIDKVNNMGKVCSKITKIAKIFLIVFLAFMILVYLMLDFCGKSIIEISMFGNINIDLDLRDFGFIYSKEDIKEQEQSKDFLDMVTAERENHIYGDYVSSGAGKIEVFKGFYEEVRGGDETHTYIYIEDVMMCWVITVVYGILSLVTLIFIEKFFKSLRDCESPFEVNIIRKMKIMAYILLLWGVVGPEVECLSNNFLNRFSFVIGINVKTLFVTVVLLFIAYIFEYGSLLQQESDETL